MTTTFLRYLTLSNPETNSERCNEGSSQKITTVYGPYDVKPGVGVTWENLNASFGHILRQTMQNPKVRDMNDVDDEKKIIRKELSVTRLLEQWSEPVVQHALNGTRETLMETGFEEYLAKGTLHFTSNAGEGDIRDEKGRMQRPDWCVYQKGQEVDGRYANLVPGDSKPASKWKAEWINSANLPNKRGAHLVLQQIAKYMWLGKTRYGFVISEEELVPVRLSVFHQGSEVVDKPLLDYEKGQITESRGSFRRDMQEEGQFEEESLENQETILFEYQDLGAPFSDEKNTIRTRLEYCRIPWSEHRAGNEVRALTINLTLWWLPMLAVQDSSIKEVDDYIPLNEVTRAIGSDSNRQKTRGSANEETQEDRPVASRKRKAESSNGPVRGSKSYRRSRGPTEPGASATPGSGQHHQGGRPGPSHGMIPNQPSTSGRVASAGPRRSERKNRGLLTSSFSSVASSSQTTNVDNR